MPSVFLHDGSLKVNELRKLRIQNLRIVNATSSAILVFRSNELLEITGIEVEGVNTAHVMSPLEFNSRAGINVTSFPATPENRIMGSVIISDNTVDGGTYNPANPLDRIIIAPVGIGVLGFAARPIEAHVEILRNTTTGRGAG